MYWPSSKPLKYDYVGMLPESPPSQVGVFFKSPDRINNSCAVPVPAGASSHRHLPLCGVAEDMGSGVIRVEGVEEHAAKALRYSA